MIKKRIELGGGVTRTDASLSLAKSSFQVASPCSCLLSCSSRALPTSSGCRLSLSVYRRYGRLVCCAILATVRWHNREVTEQGGEISLLSDSFNAALLLEEWNPLLDTNGLIAYLVEGIANLALEAVAILAVEAERRERGMKVMMFVCYSSS